MAESLDVNQLLANEYEGKRHFQWILEIDGIDAFTAKSTARPKKTHQEVAIDWINQKRFVAGKGTWDDIEVELYDPINPSQAQKVMQWLKLVHDWDVGRMGYASTYKKTFVLKLLDGPGNVVEMWKCIGAWPLRVDWGNLDYSQNELVTVKFTIKADGWQLVY